MSDNTILRNNIYVNGGTTYVVMSDDDNINIDSSLGATIVYLPNINNEANFSRRIYINDTGGQAGTNNITLKPSGANLINGESEFILSADGVSAEILIANNTEYLVNFSDDSMGPSVITWGSITGNPVAQIDLQNGTIQGTFTPSNSAISENDTFKTAFQKSQGQINNISSSLGNYFLRDGSVSATGNWNIAGFSINGASSIEANFFKSNGSKVFEATSFGLSVGLLVNYTVPSNSLLFGYNIASLATAINSSDLVGSAVASAVTGSIVESSINGFSAASSVNSLNRAIISGPFNQTQYTTLEGFMTAPEDVIVVGYGVYATGAGQAVIANSINGITDVFFGKGTRKSSSDIVGVTIRNTDPTSATNASGALGSLNLGGSHGRGTGLGGDVNLLYSVPEASGTTMQSYAVALKIDGSTGDLITLDNDVPGGYVRVKFGSTGLNGNTIITAI